MLTKVWGVKRENNFIYSFIGIFGATISICGLLTVKCITIANSRNSPVGSTLCWKFPTTIIFDSMLPTSYMYSFLLYIYLLNSAQSWPNILYGPNAEILRNNPSKCSILSNGKTAIEPWRCWKLIKFAGNVTTSPHMAKSNLIGQNNYSKKDIWPALEFRSFLYQTNNSHR